MNKLEEYREKLWIDFISSEESFGVEHDEAFEKGFRCTNKELYQYWITHIYKPEQ